ncbi:MAG TPA: hypothetical protein VNA28_07515, partial [Solirubrobacteraceae bacterium]|nr:hypothetical protein [Solirubrobacteraceae bacterium]
SNSEPFEIAAGPDGNLWFTERAAGRIGRITPAGVVTEFSAGITANARPTAIAAGADGAMWFTEADATIARITTAGVVTEYAAGLSADSTPMSIAPGANGALWFADQAGRIGRVVFEPPVVTASAATAIGETGATLNGTVDARETPTSAYFEYGTTTSYGTSTPVQAFDGAIATAASAALTGLQPATTYHFRLVATSVHGTAQATGTLTTQGTPPDPMPPGTATDVPPPAPAVIDPPLAPLAPLAMPLPTADVLQPAMPVATRLSLVVARRGRVYDGRVRVGCRLDAGALAFCSVAAYANNRRVGTVARAFAGGRVGTMRVKLSARGRRLVRRAGGVRLTYRATAVPAAGGLLRANATSRVTVS